MSRALQINSSPQGWMARNTKPVPLAEKGWVITMKKISIILLSAVLVFSMAACNGGNEKADNQTEKQMESVKPTEEVAMATEAVTEVTTEAGSEETDKDIAEAKDSEEKTDKEDNRSADNETASKQEEKPKQNDEPEQKTPASGNKEAGGNQSNAGNGGQTTDSPKDNVSNPQPASVAYSPKRKSLYQCLLIRQSRWMSRASQSIRMSAIRSQRISGKNSIMRLSRNMRKQRIRATKRRGRVLRNIMAIPIKRRTKRQHPFDN